LYTFPHHPHARYMPRPSVLLDLMILIHGEEYKLWSLFCNFLHPPAN
jgi:hypothetical protein